MVASIVITSLIIPHHELSCYSSPQIFRQHRKRRRPRNTLHRTSPTKELYLTYIFCVLCYTVIFHDGRVDTVVCYASVMGMINEWIDHTRNSTTRMNDYATGLDANHSEDPHRWNRNDAQHSTKQRFRRWIRQKRQHRQKRIEHNKQLHVPIIDDPGLTFHLHPTSILSMASERRKLLLEERPQYHEFDDNKHANRNSSSARKLDNDRHHRENLTKSKGTADDIRLDDDSESLYYRQWFAPHETSAVYATIPDQHDPRHRNNRELHDYYALRHLSRYEQQYRIFNQYNLQRNWNGLYDTIFLQHIVHFDDDIFLSKRGEKYSSNNELRQQNFQNTTEKYISYNESQIHRQRIPRHINQHRKTTTSTSSASSYVSYTGGIYNNYQSVPLSQGYGTHFANVWVGTPVPQRKTVIVDTGSHYTAFPCTGCKDCGAPHHTDPYYRPENSKTFQQLQCNECQDGVPCEDSKW